MLTKSMQANVQLQWIEGDYHDVDLRVTNVDKEEHLEGEEV